MNTLKTIVLCIFGSFFLCMASAHAKDSKDNKGLTNLIQKNLHPKVRNIFLKAKSKQDIEEALGRPDLVENETYFYIIGGFKYSLSITFDKKYIKKIRFRLPKSGDSNSAFSRYLLNTPKIIEGKGAHSKGRYFSQNNSKQGIKFVFKNNSKKSLFSIVRTIKGRK